MHAKGLFSGLAFSAGLLICQNLLPPNVFGLDAASQETAFKHETGVTLKLIQVVVTDKKGNPITDLKKEEFTLSDNGRVVKLTEFERHGAGGNDTDRMTSEQRNSAVPPVRLGRTLFFIFDFAYADPQGIRLARDASLRFIDSNLRPEDKVGVLSFSGTRWLQVHEFLTNDHGRIRQYVESFGPQSLMKVLINPKVDPDSEQVKVKKRDEDVVSVNVAGPEAGYVARNFVWAMTSLAQSLRYLPGQKTIVLFSSGIPGALLFKGELQWARNSNIDLRFAYLDMCKDLAAANVAVYPINTEPRSEKSDSDTGVVSLEKMASATGGRYLGRSLDSTDHLEEIQALTKSYYVLGFPIKDSADGRYHKVSVRVSRPGCQVRAQEGYFDPKPFSEYSELEKQIELVDLALAEIPLSQTPVRFSMRALVQSSGPPNNIGLIAEIPLKKIAGVMGRKVEAVSLVFNAADDIVDSKRTVVDLASISRDTAFLSCVFSAPAGPYRYSFVLRNIETGKAAVACTTGSVPTRINEDLIINPPLLLSAERGSVFITEKGLVKPGNKNPNFPFAETFRFDAAEFAPFLDINLKGGVEIHALVACDVQKSESSSLELSASIADRTSEKQIQVPVTVISKEYDRGSVMYLVKLTMPAVEPGGYTLSFTAKTESGKISSIYNEVIID